MDLDAFILIGGSSSRLGEDKALIEFDGETLAARAARTIETALSPCQINFVSRDANQFEPDLDLKLGYPVITDLRPGHGAWSGIDAALSHCQQEWAFILACDLPFISTDLLQLLAIVLIDDVDAVVPRQPDGRLQPLAAFYRVRPTLEVVKKIFDHSDFFPPLHSIFDDLKTQIAGPDAYGLFDNAERFFLNINTENDLAAALS